MKYISGFSNKLFDRSKFSSILLHCGFRRLGQGYPCKNCGPFYFQKHPDTFRVAISKQMWEESNPAKEHKRSQKSQKIAICNKCPKLFLVSKKTSQSNDNVKITKLECKFWRQKRISKPIIS